jgi:hypothetical protein
MKKYWYICHVYECPVCGHCEQERERVYEKPDKYWVFHLGYDWCDAF